jgi:hypothetical protein
VPHIAVDNHLYDLGFAFENGTTCAEVVATFTEVETSWTEVRLTGGKTTGLKLTSKGGPTALFWHPGTTVKVPRGFHYYALCAIDVESSAGVRRFTAVAKAPGGGELACFGDTAALECGGSLRLVPEVRRSRRNLVLSCRITDGSGEKGPSYTSDGQAPAFEVWLGDDLLRSGKLEYG